MIKRLIRLSMRATQVVRERAFLDLYIIRQIAKRDETPMDFIYGR